MDNLAQDDVLLCENFTRPEMEQMTSTELINNDRIQEVEGISMDPSMQYHSFGPLTQKRSVYINKKLLNLRDERKKDEKEVGIIYYNPKFIKKQSHISDSDALLENAKLNLKNKNESIKPKIHINPKFLPKKCNVFEDQVKKDKVFINPTFLRKVSLDESQKPANLLANEPECSKRQLNQNVCLNSASNSSVTNISNDCQTNVQFALSSAKANSRQVSRNKLVSKYKLVNRKRRKSSNNSNLNRTVIEFKKTKYTLKRKIFSSDSPNKKNEKNKEDRNIFGVYKKLEAKKLVSNRQKVSDMDPFKYLGRTKLVRKSIVRSMIEARRNPLNFVKRNSTIHLKGLSTPLTHRKRLPSDSKLSRIRSLRTRYKIIHKNPQDSLLTPKRNVSSTRKRKRKNLVCIDGAVYSSSPHKLTRKNEIRKGGRVISIGGVNYSINRDAKSLRKIDKNIGSSMVSPATFLSPHLKQTPLNIKKQDIYSKMVLRSSRNRSIMILTAKLRKQNLPCIFYNRFGYCKRYGNGNCHKLHDKKYVLLCNKFLRGNCSNVDCLLSHDPIPEKMPLCEYYLSGGHCLVDNCPYLHINHGHSAALCRMFLKGFCPNGADCSDRHEFTCPILARKGVCPNRLKCPYPHPKKYFKLYSAIKNQKKDHQIQAVAKGKMLTDPTIKRDDKDSSSEVSNKGRYFKAGLKLSGTPGEKDKFRGEKKDDVNDSIDSVGDTIIEIDDDLSDFNQARVPFPDLPEFLPLT